MDSATTSNTTPSTACTTCCQLSLTSLDSCGNSGSDMNIDTARSFQRICKPNRTSAGSRGVAIFPCPSGHFYSTEDDVQEVPKALSEWHAASARGQNSGTETRDRDNPPSAVLRAKLTLFAGHGQGRS